MAKKKTHPAMEDLAYIAYCDAIFHFNKKHLEDPSIPMWVIKTRGKTFYLEHISFQGIDFETKETPDNDHTKGSLKFKDVIFSMDHNKQGLITYADPDSMSKANAWRMTHEGKIVLELDEPNEVKAAMKKNGIKHGPFTEVEGSCGSTFQYTYVTKPEDVTLLALSCPDAFEVVEPGSYGFQRYASKLSMKTLG